MMFAHKPQFVFCLLSQERLTLCCGGVAVNSFEDLSPSCLGTAGLVCVITFSLQFLCFVFVVVCSLWLLCVLMASLAHPAQV